MSSAPYDVAISARSGSGSGRRGSAYESAVRLAEAVQKLAQSLDPLRRWRIWNPADQGIEVSSDLGETLEQLYRNAHRVVALITRDWGEPGTPTAIEMRVVAERLNDQALLEAKGAADSSRLTVVVEVDPLDQWGAGFDDAVGSTAFRSDRTLIMRSRYYSIRADGPEQVDATSLAAIILTGMPGRVRPRRPRATRLPVWARWTAGSMLFVGIICLFLIIYGRAVEGTNTAIPISTTSTTSTSVPNSRAEPEVSISSFNAEGLTVVFRNVDRHSLGVVRSEFGKEAFFDSLADGERLIEPDLLLDGVGADYCVVVDRTPSPDRRLDRDAALACTNPSLLAEIRKEYAVSNE